MNKLFISFFIVLLLSSFTLGFGYNHFKPIKENVELNYMCGDSQRTIALSEPDGQIDENDLWELDRQCNLTVKDIKNNRGHKLVKVNNTNIFKFEITQYYCKDRDIYYDCDGFSKYYQLEQGKCLSPEGNKLCRTGWMLI